jgi:hypothetical protein
VTLDVNVTTGNAVAARVNTLPTVPGGTSGEQGDMANAAGAPMQRAAPPPTSLVTKSRLLVDWPEVKPFKLNEKNDTEGKKNVNPVS